MSTKRIKVLFLNPFGNELLDYIKKRIGKYPIDLVIPSDSERDSLMVLVPDADILIGWGSDPELLEKAKQVKLFINPGTGIKQHIENFKALDKSRNIVLVNGHGNSYAVAQHTVALLLSLTNKVTSFHLKMKELREPEGERNTRYFKNLKVGFLGYGAINTKVHRFLSGFDISFVAYRRDWSKVKESTITTIDQYSEGQLQDFFKESDVVVNSLPATTETKNMVTMKEFKCLGKNGYFINVGRAATVIQEDMYMALKENIIAGAALEVWWGKGEPNNGRHDPYQYPFHELDNLIMSPHRAANCGGDLDRWDEVIENLIRFSEGRQDLLNIVNIDLEY